MNSQHPGDSFRRSFSPRSAFSSQFMSILVILDDLGVSLLVPKVPESALEGSGAALGESGAAVVQPGAALEGSGAALEHAGAALAKPSWGCSGKPGEALGLFWEGLRLLWERLGPRMWPQSRLRADFHSNIKEIIGFEVSQGCSGGKNGLTSHDRRISMESLYGTCIRLDPPYRIPDAQILESSRKEDWNIAAWRLDRGFE